MRPLFVCLFGGLAAAVSLNGQNAAPSYAFWTLAGRANVPGTTDGTGGDARFNRPWGIAVDSQGNLYVTEAVGHVVRKITPAGVVTTLAGRVGEVGSENGSGTAARFAATGTSPVNSTSATPVGPFGITVDGNGISHVADGSLHLVRRVTPAGLVSTFSGVSGTSGYNNGGALDALYRNPVGVAIDASGNIFVADTFNHSIRRISTSGDVTTIAGNPEFAGHADGIGSAARFFHPTAITVSPQGIVYVAESNNTIRRLAPTSAPDAWSVSTLAGSPFTFGATDGTGPEARFGGAPIVSPSGGQTVSYPSFAPILSSPTFLGSSYRLGDLPGLAADAAGNVYVSDFGNNVIRRISASGVVTTIGGATIGGSADGVETTARFRGPCGIAIDPAGTLYIADSMNHTIRKAALPAPPRIESQPGNQTVAAGANITLSVTASGSPPPTFQWTRNGSPVNGVTGGTLVLNNVQPAHAGTYTATLTNVAGTTFMIPVVLTVTSGPLITTQPVNQSLLGGQTLRLSVNVTASPTPTYQWLRDGVPIPGETGASLTVNSAQDIHAGEYRVVVTNALGSTTSNPAIVAVNTGRIINLSIRSALAGSDPLIAGFVVSGGTKSLLIRAVGPALGAFGVGNPMLDPQLSVQVGSVVLASNDNWSTASNAMQLASLAAQVGAFVLPTGGLDAAAAASVSNNAATAQASARNGVGGVVLLELFETGGASLGRLVNVSTRARVGTGENALFAGFVIGGNSPRRLLIRAVGPTLSAFGVGGTLADPLLEVYATGVTTPQATNDNWNGNAALTSTFSAVGAFPLPATSSLDAALVVSLAPGSYSARVAGVGGTTGEVLLEIYEVP